MNMDGTGNAKKDVFYRAAGKVVHNVWWKRQIREIRAAEARADEIVKRGPGKERDNSGAD